MFCLLLRFLLAGAVGTHGIANGQVSLLRMNEMVKNDMAKPLKTF